MDMVADNKTDQDIVSLIIGYLESDITDPNSVRKAEHKKWIYDDEPLPNITGYPRIAVTAPVNNTQILDIGFTKEMNKPIVAVFVIVNKGQKVKINNVEYRDLKLLDYLVEAVRECLLINNRADLESSGIYLKPPEKTFIQGDSTYSKYLRFPVVYFRDMIIGD